MTARNPLAPEDRRAGRRWHAAIWIGLGVVVLVNFAVVWVAQRTDRGLVRDDYYEAALAWDARHAARRRLGAGEIDVTVTREGEIRLTGPAAVSAVVEGVFFYRPDDPKADLRTAVRPGSQAGYWTPISVPTRGGRWRVAVAVETGDAAATLVSEWHRR